MSLFSSSDYGDSGGVLGGTSAVMILVLLLVYRNWRYEQELDSLLWKVDFKDIQMNDNEQASNNKINRACSNCFIKTRKKYHNSVFLTACSR
ncbi:hypothetical protein J6590_085631 [Homalodisca vitripennis]|nr:hypothetical protein J6590_068157 [Homalodisca vitripennis]KAG8285216.1 hypothetical protein J6590_085631 [Homalodisca vitripennis]